MARYIGRQPRLRCRALPLPPLHPGAALAGGVALRGRSGRIRPAGSQRPGLAQRAGSGVCASWPIRFPAVWRGETWLLAEDFDHRHTEGDHLGDPVSGRMGHRARRAPVLETPWHLSYPFLIEDGGEIWMIPESFRPIAACGSTVPTPSDTLGGGGGAPGRHRDQRRHYPSPGRPLLDVRRQSGGRRRSLRHPIALHGRGARRLLAAAPGQSDS